MLQTHPSEEHLTQEPFLYERVNIWINKCIPSASVQVHKGKEIPVQKNCTEKGCTLFCKIMSRILAFRFFVSQIKNIHSQQKLEN